MSKKYDAVILGAGINGVSIAHALTALGKRVIIIEKHSIAHGASSRSSRLIHGGLRYLENFEFSLVKEALHDQAYLLEKYPDLVELHPFYLPIYAGFSRPIWMVRLGLWLYRFLYKHHQKPKSTNKKQFLEQFSAFKEAGLKEVFCYYDAKTDDKALTERIAKESGAHIVFEGIADISLEKEILIKTDERSVSTSLLINATGAWIDEVTAQFNLPSSFSIQKVSGIHLLIDKVLVAEPVLLEASDKRVFFMIPEKNSTLIGTTERLEETTMDEVKVNNEDIEYLLTETNHYLKKPLGRGDIKEAFIGVRPLIASKGSLNTISREYKLDIHQFDGNTLVNVYGGKLTTSTSLAKKTIDLLRKSRSL